MIKTIPQVAAINRGESPKLREVKLSQSEQIISQISARLQPIIGVESAWLENLGEIINVYIETNNVRNATLYPVFDAQYEVESEYSSLIFHFIVNPLDLEQIQTSSRIRRLF